MLLKGKKGVVFGLANKLSLAWHIGQALHAEGAEVMFGVASERFRDKSAPLAESIGSPLPLICDVTDDASIEQTFAEWGRIDLLLNNGIMATYPGGFPTAQEQFGVSHMQGDYAAIAMGMGAEGLRVEIPAEMGPALKKAQQLNSDGKTVLIDVKTRNVDSRSPDRFA